MNKLCCILNPDNRCIGCDVPLCDECFLGCRGAYGLEKCTATYYQQWIHSAEGHAFNDAYHMLEDREWEAKGKAKGLSPKIL